MSYLITGANGFIGRNIVRILIERTSEKIYLLDQYHSEDYLHEQLIPLTLDLTSNCQQDLPSDISVVIHLAAKLGVDFVSSNPISTVCDNISMFSHLQNYIDDPSVKFVFFSTSEVYGDGSSILPGSSEPSTAVNKVSNQLELPYFKDPRSSYALSKMVGEFLSFRSRSHLIFRPHNIYGPNMGTRHVIPQLISKIMNAEAGGVVPVYNPEHIRSFCYIDDAVDQIVSRILSEEEGVVNVGSSKEPTKIETLFEMLVQLMGADVELQPNYDAHKSSPAFRQPEIDAEWNNKATPLHIGLKSMVDFYGASEG